MRRLHLLAFALTAPVAVLTPVACGTASTSAGPSPDAGGADGKGGAETGTAAPDSAADAPADTPPDVDNGAPSTSYPAPHPAMPQLVNGTGGPVLTAPKVYLVFFPTSPAYPYIAPLQDFAQKMVASTFWATTTHEYGVGALTYGGTITLTGQAPPASTSSTEIQTWVEAQLQAGTFGAPDPQAIYTIFYPQSTTITQPNPVSTLLPSPQSCVAFGGYHDNATLTPDGGGAAKNFAYAVIPTCSSGASTADDLTSVVSHEWVEAATDPYLTSSGAFTLTGGPNAAFYAADKDHIIWDLLGGGEAGDLCEPEGSPIYVTPADVGHSVQRTWSNAAAQGSHDPCVPGISGAFFDSAPVMPATVTFTSSITGTVTTKGLVIPAGQSKTIEVDLFSDGDTGGPWTVTADDVLSKYYGSYGLPKTLSFAWDRTQGVNGEKLHLTITVMTAFPLTGGGHAFMITSSKGGRQTVWPGLVVEQ